MGDLWKVLSGPLGQLGGTALSTVLQGVAGPVLGPVIGKIAADALGVSPDPASIIAGLQTNPNAATIVQQIEAQQGPVMLQAAKSAEEIAAADRADARAHERSLVENKSPLAYAGLFVDIFIVVGFVAISIISLVKPSGMDGQVLNSLFTAWLPLVTYVVGYHRGSSAGSAQKSNQIDAMQAADRRR